MNEECRNKLRGLVYEMYGTQLSFTKAIKWRPGKINCNTIGQVHSHNTGSLPDL